MMIQYRASGLIWMIGAVLDPIIFLVVWSVAARASGGTVGGMAPSDFAAYYIVLMLVNHLTLTHAKLVLRACCKRELWHATNCIKVLGSERNSANTIWDYYICFSIFIPLCYKNNSHFFAASSPGL